MNKMTKSQKNLLLRIICGLFLFVTGLFIPHPHALFLMVPAYLIAGYSVLWGALLNIRRGHIFDENFLMSIATVGAVCLNKWDEAVGVMLFYMIGLLFEQLAVGKSRNSIAALMELRPDTATILKDGTMTEIDSYEVNVGDTIVVKPGERIPLDGVLLEGNTSLDTSALTGESIPVDIVAGDSINSGCINISNLIHMSVTTPFEDSTVSRILDLVENAASKKARMERFITRFARYYTPVVVSLAVALALLPPLIVGGLFGPWVYRALLFLVISCPCALVISVPLSFFGGVGAAGKSGILVKGSNYLEVLSEIETVIFDKTGTLTTGSFKVTDVNGPHDTLELAAYAECHSSHPIALSICETYGKPIYRTKIESMTEYPGKGVFVTYNGRQIYAGNSALMEDLSVEIPLSTTDMTFVYISVDGEYYGSIALADEIKPDAQMAVAQLKHDGVSHIAMLTGDRPAIATSVAEKIGISRVHSLLLPGDKVRIAEEIIGSEKHPVAFVGDGINDAPVLALSGVGIAMGGLGSQAAIEAADIVIMDDDLTKISLARFIAKKTLAIAKFNVAFALGVKGIVLILGALGMASMWTAVFADVGVSILAILNSMRTLLIKK